MLDKLFILLLKWYCTNRLDQWERWKFKTKYGSDIYVDISRQSDGYNYNDI
jgi:hypothetical protein